MSQHSGTSNETEPKQRILHICRREVLRPLRDQILRISGYEVDSTCVFGDAVAMFQTAPYDLVLIDVESDDSVPHAENLCSAIKTTRHEQLVAFVCNWRIAQMTDCPDEILRTEFDPAAFVKGIRQILPGR